MIEEISKQTKEEKEHMKVIHQIDKDNYDKMLAEKERIQNAIKQMNIKMAAHKQRQKSNPAKMKKEL